MPGTIFRSLCALLLVMVLNATCRAATDNAALSRDFAPHSGYLVGTAGEEYLIDLDARQQIAVGDLFTVVTPGEPIVHPVSKAVLGSPDTVKGILQVTRVKAGYSQCRALGKAPDLRRGDTVRRFLNIDALFWDYTGKGEPYFEELLVTLPQLQWQSYRATQERRPAAPSQVASAALYFILTGQGLEVRAPDFSLLHSYPAAVAVAGAPVAAPVVQAPAGAAVTSLAPPSGRPVPVRPVGALPGPASRVPDAEVGPYWTSPQLKGTPVGLEVGDLDGDGQQEIAVAFADRVEISRLVRGSYRLLAVVPWGGSLRAYHLDGADLQKNGRMQLFVSAVTGSGNLSGVGIAWEGGAYRITRNKIPWHLRRMVLPGEGVVLVGQEMGGAGQEFAGPVFRVGLADDRLVEGDPVATPKQSNLYDFTPLATAGTPCFAALDADGYLKLARWDGGDTVSSVDRTGGSESYLELDEDSQSGGERRVRYLPARIEAAARGELLVPANSGSSLLSRTRTFSKSQLQALVPDGGALREVWHTSVEKSYLADFRIAEVDNDGRRLLVTLVAFPESNPFGISRKAALHVYTLPDNLSMR
jgi:hypothetical protein